MSSDAAGDHRTPDGPTRPRRADALSWVSRVVAIAALAVAAWALITSPGAVVHGHPAYAVVLAVTVVAAAIALWTSFARRPRRGAWRLTGRIVLVVGGAAGVALTAWLRPYQAVEPALAAMVSSDAVAVVETATDIVLEPTAAGGDTGVFFQPGALVDPRAYAAVLLPLAEEGHTVVIAKQPLGIAFLALGAFDQTRAAHPDISSWVVGGHSLGGTVAAIQADGTDADATAPATGLFFYASYPATDISSSLTIPVDSISGTRDGLSTPDKIDASRADLPADATFTVIDGASHAQFGDYGPQAGDGTPTISHDDARAQISAATIAFVDSIAS
jgi:Alpha/beta hydrolase family